MNMFEEAASIRAMMALRDMTQSKIAKALGVSQPYVANKLRLLEYTDEERAKILEYGLTERHARTILRLSAPNDRLIAIEKCHTMKMNVSRCEITVDSILDERLRACAPEGENYAEHIGHFERSLESSLMLLRKSGIRARARREADGERIYFSICIE